MESVEDFYCEGGDKGKYSFDHYLSTFHIYYEGGVRQEIIFRAATMSTNAFSVPQTPEEIQQFYLDNQSLIHAALKPYKGLYDYQDLFQEASIGFVKGIQTYNPLCSTKLSTYCYICAQNEVKMSLRKNGAKSRSALVVSLEFGADPDNTDSVLNHEEQFDTLRAVAKNVEDTFLEKELCQQALKVISKMDEESRTVIFYSMHRIPQAKIAERLHTTQGYVSKVLKKALCSLSLQLHELDLVE